MKRNARAKTTQSKEPVIPRQDSAVPIFISEPIRASIVNQMKTNSDAKILGVALDMDGLLFDTERLYWDVGDTLLQRRGHRYTAELQKRMMGRVGVAALQQMIDFHELDDSAESLLAESDELYIKRLADGVDPMPGLAQWINLLSEKRMPFGLATSSRRKFVDIILRDVQWRDSLAFVLTGDDVTHGKPHPEMYLTAANRFAIAPSNMLVLEDSGNGCAAAIAAGAHTVAIPSEHTHGHSFEGTQLVAESLMDERLWRLIG